jgi:hypothetical protein
MPLDLAVFALMAALFWFMTWHVYRTLRRKGYTDMTLEQLPRDARVLLLWGLLLFIGAAAFSALAALVLISLGGYA